VAAKLPLKIESGQLRQFAVGDTIDPSIAPGSGGSPIFTTVEVNLGAAPNARRSGRFQITGSGLTAGKPVLVRQAAGPYTGKGTRSDEAEMDRIACVGTVKDAITIEVYWQSERRARGNVKFAYLVGG